MSHLKNILPIMENNVFITLSCFTESEASGYYMSSVYFSLPHNRGAV